MSDPLQPHVHDPNPTPPSLDPTLSLGMPDGIEQTLSVSTLLSLPQHVLTGCYIVSTGHGTSGPFEFAGPTLETVLRAYGVFLEREFEVEIWGGDGFGTQVARHELLASNTNRAIILACYRDGALLSRAEGLVRLIVPGERDDALRQVKWVREIRLRASDPQASASVSAF